MAPRERGAAGGGSHRPRRAVIPIPVSGKIPTFGSGQGRGAVALVGGPDTSTIGVHDLRGIKGIDGDVASPVADTVAA